MRHVPNKFDPIAGFVIEFFQVISVGVFASLVILLLTGIVK
jgi:hypothetical protein